MEANNDKFNTHMCLFVCVLLVILVAKCSVYHCEESSDCSCPASSDQTARLWSVDGGDVKREYTGHQKPITCLAFRDEVVS